MALTPRQRRFIDRFLPGLIEAIGNLGPGDFSAKEPELNCLGTDQIIGVAVRFRYELADGTSVEVRSRWSLKADRPPYVPPSGPFDPDDWERYSYSLHYGRSVSEVIFRFDLDESNGYHVHIPPNTDIHTLAEHVEPDTRDLQPLKFVEMVAEHRSTGTYPVKRKQPPGGTPRRGKRMKK